MSKKYKKDYTITKKDILYTGDYYTSAIDAGNKKKIVLQCILALALLTALFLGAGFLNNDGSRNFFIVMPFIFLVLPMLYFGMGIYHLCRVGERMEFAQMDKSIGRLYRCAVGMQVLSAYLCAADFMFLFFRFREIRLIREVIFFLIMTVYLVFGIYIGKKTRKIKAAVKNLSL